MQMQGMAGNIFILQGLENSCPVPNFLKKFTSQYRRCALAECRLRYLCKGKIQEPPQDKLKTGGQTIARKIGSVNGASPMFRHLLF